MFYRCSLHKSQELFRYFYINPFVQRFSRGKLSIENKSRQCLCGTHTLFDADLTLFYFKSLYYFFSFTHIFTNFRSTLLCWIFHLHLFHRLVSFFSQSNLFLFIIHGSIYISIYLSKSIYIYFSLFVCMYVCIYHHHDHVVPPAWISLTLSRHFSLRQVFRATSRILTELLYVCSSWSSCFCSAICGVHRRTSLMRTSLLLQQCPACLVRLIWIVFVMGGRWPYSWCFMGCCLQDMFNIARNILV